MIVRALMTVLLLLGVSGVAKLLQADEPMPREGTPTLLGGRLLQPDGTLRDSAVLVIRNGRVERIGSPAEFAGQLVHRLGDQAVISPGMIDLFATPGVLGQTVEDTEAVDAEVNPRWVLNPGDRDFRTALEAGITSMLVGPAATNLVNGVCITTRTHNAGSLDILRRDGPMLFAFGEGVWRADRKPTSRSGATYELRELVAQARKEAAHPRINAAIRGELAAWVACSSREDVVAVRHVLGDAASHFGWIHTKDAIDVAALLRGSPYPVVVGPYSLNTTRRELLGAAALATAGLDVAFRAGFPAASAQAIRLSAALAVRHGMDPAAARRAMTISPAKVAGVAGQLGSLVPGKDADLVIFSQDPLRMDARVLEVYVLGDRVYADQHRKTSLAGGQP